MPGVEFGGGGGSGDIVGPIISTDNAVARFNGTTGKSLQSSPATLSDNGELVVTSQDAGAIPIVGKGASSQTADLLQLQDDSSNVKARVDENGQLYSNNVASAPDNTEFQNGQHTVWLDESASRFQIKGKKADGTVVSQDLPDSSDIPNADVTGPASSTDNAITRFDSTTGKILQNSAALVDDNGQVFSHCPATAPSDGNIANSQFAIWLDEDLDRFQIKGKQADGTVISQDVPDISGGELIMEAVINTSVPIMTVGHATQAVDLFQARDNSANVLARISKEGQIYSNNVSSEPDNTEFQNGQHTVWLDEPSSRFQIKGKKADGTVVTQDLPDSSDIPTLPQYALLTQRATAGTDGGGISSGSMVTRPITNKDVDEIGLTLSSNQITFPAGTYRIHAELVNYNVGAIRSKLRNITDTANVSGVFNPTHLTNGGGSNIHPISKLLGQFTLADTKTLEIQQQVSSTQNSNGLGKAANLDSLEEVYAIVEIWKLS